MKTGDSFHFVYLSICICLLSLPLSLNAETNPQSDEPTSEPAVEQADESTSLKIETTTLPEKALKDPELQAETEAAREREQTAEEDPIAQRQAERIDQPAEWSFKPDEFKFYGSARVRYRKIDGDSFWGDGGSRVGISGQWEYKENSWVFGRLELGINILDELDLILNRSGRSSGSKLGDTLFFRLFNVGVETPNYIITTGKSWSTFYQVTSFTDRFQGTGASASGTYNAGTDGGYTGTGRADRVLQGRFLVNTKGEIRGLKPFKLNLQVQHGEPIPTLTDFNYKTTIGISALLETREDFTFGLAYNHAHIDSADLAELKSHGIDGDAIALALGTRWFSENWYLGTVLTRLENHETTDQDIYFDGTGWEVYGQYHLHKKWWAVVGWNYLSPDSDEVQAGAYRVKYGVLGLRYSFKVFRQMIFANARLESSRSQEDTALGNVYTVGVRWDFN